MLRRQGVEMETQLYSVRQQEESHQDLTYTFWVSRLEKILMVGFDNTEKGGKNR